MKKAVCYYRVSRNIQSDLRQERDVKDYCKDNGYTIVETFREKISGTKRKRKEMTACLDYIHANNIKYIVCSELSRLGRTNEVISNIDELTQKKICVISLKESIKTLKDDFSKDADQLLLVNIIAGINNKESDTISYRIKSGINNKVLTNGSWSGGKFLPYGYVSVKGKLVIDPKESETVKLIFEKYNSGWGSIKIANWLNLNNIPTKLNHKWQRSTINQMIKHSIYRGQRVWQGEQLNTIDLAIIDPITFESVQNRLKMAKNSNPDFNKLKKYSYLFDNGLIKCGVCGKRYFGVHREQIYKCNSGKYSRGCGCPSVKIQWLEETIQYYLVKNSYKLLTDSTELQNKTELLEIDLKLMEQEQQKQTLKSERYKEMYSDGLLTKPKLTTNLKTSIDLLTKISNNIQELQSKIEANRTAETFLVFNKNLFDDSTQTAKVGIPKDTLHKVVKQIKVNMVDCKRVIEVMLINGNAFNIGS
jgi:site-specific DNA recombinase